MTERKIIVSMFVVLIFLSHQVSIGKAFALGEAKDENSTPVEVKYLSDGVIEKRYSDGTVRHELLVSTVIPLTVGLSSTAFIRPPPPSMPDLPDENPFSYAPLFRLFLSIMGAEGILSMLAKALSLSKLPKPVQIPSRFSFQKHRKIN